MIYHRILEDKSAQDILVFLINYSPPRFRTKSDKMSDLILKRGGIDNIGFIL